MKSLICAVTFLACLQVSLAHATSTAMSEVTLDWSGALITTSGELVIDHLDIANINSGSTAASSFGLPAQDAILTHSYPLTQSETSSTSSYSTPEGAASTTASSHNGLLTSRSDASSTSLIAGPNAQANWTTGTAFTNSAFWLYGQGAGSLQVQIPYRLDLSLEASGDEYVTASAQVSLLMGNVFEDSLLWPNTLGPFSQTLSRTGYLTSSLSFDNPTWGPLVVISTHISTMAQAVAVPEPSTLFFLGAALLAGGLGRWWVKDWRTR